MPHETTLDDVLAAINGFSTQVDRRFVQIESRLSFVETNMVTKDYLDKKLKALRDELVLLAHRGNTKLSVLVDDLVAQKSLSAESARKVLALEPFPQG